MKTILVTGVAGFIGAYTAEALLKEENNVFGVDNFNDYYDVSLKRARIKRFCPNIKLYEVDCAEPNFLSMRQQKDTLS